MADRRLYGDYFGALNQDYTSPFETGELKVKKTFYVVVVKRFFDIVISLIAVVVTLPINLIMAIITFFTLGNPIIFSHYRPGLGEKLFKMVKFRNMTNEKDEKGELLPPDQRVTKVGAFFRKTSLDELLQFWLILIGKMSIIGPRPLLVYYLPGYSKKQHLRHSVKPGLECPLPVYKGEVTWEDRLNNDIWYAENVSFVTDIKMVFRLIKLVFNTDRAKTRSEKIDKSFVDLDAK